MGQSFFTLVFANTISNVYGFTLRIMYMNPESESDKIPELLIGFAYPQHCI